MGLRAAAADQRRTATTVAEGNLLGGWETKGDENPHPPTRQKQLGSMTVTQQLEIAAAGHGETTFDEPYDGIAQRGCFPWFGGDTRITIDGDCDFAVSRTVQASVVCAQHLADTPPALRRQPYVCGDTTAKQHRAKPAQRMKPIQRGGIEDQNSDEDTVGWGIDTGDFKAFTGNVDSQMESIDAVKGVRADEILSSGGIAWSEGHPVEQNCPRVGIRGPEDRMIECCVLGIGGESTTPIVRRRREPDRYQAARAERGSRRLSGNPRFAEGIPKQARTLSIDR